MTRVQAQIAELFQSLPPAEQRELVEHLADQTLRGDFYDHMTPSQKAELAAAIAQADNGQTISSNELKSYMAARFNLKTA
jgi:hypothetical protein